MAPASNACWWRQIASVTLTVPGETAVPGETESSSAEVQLDKRYLGRPCANSPAGPRRTWVRRGLFSKSPLDTGVIPQKTCGLELAHASVG